MRTDHVFCGLPVSDIASARSWYERLFGRGPDMLPNESEAVWRLAGSVSVYVVEDKDRAGRGLLTIAVDDLDRAVTELHERGTRATTDEAHVPRRAIVRDGDGNTITFFAV